MQTFSTGITKQIPVIDESGPLLGSLAKMGIKYWSLVNKKLQIVCGKRFRIWYWYGDEVKICGLKYFGLQKKTKKNKKWFYCTEVQLHIITHYHPPYEVKNYQTETEIKKIDRAGKAFFSLSKHFFEFALFVVL